MATVPAKIDIAAQLAEQGYLIFPINHISKHPAEKKSYKLASDDPKEIRFKWSQDYFKDCNPGVACQDRIIIIDVDPKPGSTDAQRSLKMLMDMGLPKTRTVKTPSGGVHLYYKHPGRWVKSVANNWPGIDIRGNGGYVLGPGSTTEKGKSCNAGTYVLTDDREIATLPLNIVVQLPFRDDPRVNPLTVTDNQRPSLAQAALATEPSEFSKIPEKIAAGGRDDKLFRYACSMRERSIPYDMARELMKVIWSKCEQPANDYMPVEEAWGKLDRAWKEYSPSNKNELRQYTPSPGNAESNTECQNPWPILNDKALHGFLKRFVNLACLNSEADPAAVLMTSLVRFAAEVGNGIVLMVGDTKHYSRIVSVVVGNSSKARKGTSAKPVDRLFESLQNGARTSPGPFSSGEGIIYSVRDETREWKKTTDSKEGHFIVSDPGVDDKRFFILDEEFSSALTCIQREGNTLSVILRCAWDNGNLDPLTKTSKIKATGAHVCWLSHVTIIELLNKLQKSDSFNGFSNRILWVCAKRQKEIPFPEPMPITDLKPFQAELQDILDHSKNISKLELDDSAKDLWGEVYSNLTKDHPGLAGCVINRGEAQALRLAMIYCLLDKDKMIRRSHLEAALAMWQYCRDSAFYIFHGKAENPPTDLILDALGTGAKSTTELHQLFNNNIYKDKLQVWLAELIASGKVGMEKVSTGGAPKTLYSLAAGEPNS